MKKIALIIVFLIVLTSCGDDKIGVDIGGDKTVEVSFKQMTDSILDINYTSEGMFIAFDAVVRAMMYYDMPYSDDSLFMWRTLTMMLNYSGEATIYDDVVHGMHELVSDYVSACFGGVKTIPPLDGGVVHNPDSMVYAVPRIKDYQYDNYTVEVGDIIDNGDGTFNFYINYTINNTGDIGEQYIFTVIDNPITPIESKYPLMYSIIRAAVLEL